MPLGSRFDPPAEAEAPPPLPAEAPLPAPPPAPSLVVDGDPPRGVAGAARCGTLIYPKDLDKRARFEALFFGSRQDESPSLPAIRRRRLFVRRPGAAQASVHLASQGDGSAALYIGDTVFFTLPEAKASAFLNHLDARGPFSASGALEIDLWECLGVTRLSLRIPLPLGYLILADCMLRSSVAFEACSLFAATLGFGCYQETQSICQIGHPLKESSRLIVFKEAYPGLPTIYELLVSGEELRLQELLAFFGLANEDRLPSVEFVYALLGAAFPPGCFIRRTFVEPGTTPHFTHPLCGEFFLALSSQVALWRALSA
jgi:hypothetical protein